MLDSSMATVLPASNTLEPTPTPNGMADQITSMSTAVITQATVIPQFNSPKQTPVITDASGEAIVFMTPAQVSQTNSDVGQLNIPSPDDHGKPSPFSAALWIALFVVVVAAASFLVFRKRKPPIRHERFMQDEEITKTEPIMPAVSLQIGTAQYIGTREEQEDALCCSEYRNPALLDQKGVFAAVADGVGGMSDGQLASTTAVRGMLTRFVQQTEMEEPSMRLLKLAAAAHKDVLELNSGRNQPCGSTLVSVLIVRDGLHFVSVGDSRILLYRMGGLLQLNRDHTLGAELDVQIALGQRPAEDMQERRRKAITAYLGKEGLKLIDRNIHPIPLLHGDRILLMSDGVFGTISDAEIIEAQRLEPAAAANEMIQRVQEHRRTHQDNATVIIINYMGGYKS